MRFTREDLAVLGKAVGVLSRFGGGEASVRLFVRRAAVAHAEMLLGPEVVGDVRGQESLALRAPPPEQLEIPAPPPPGCGRGAA